MSATTNYGGGWISGRGTGSDCVRQSTITALVVSAMMVGTGGLLTANYLAKRADRGYAYHQVAKMPSAANGALQRTPKENLERVREVLKPAVSELASMFGVSRQAIYDWQDGAQPGTENAARLGDLAEAADVLSNAGIANTPRLGQRQIISGKTLFDVVRAGRSAKEAAHTLAQVLLREHEQRSVLQARLNARQRQPVDYRGAGAPMFDGDTT